MDVETISFIVRNISSARELDILLILSKEPDRKWTCDEIAVLLGLPATVVGNRLLRLWDNGLVMIREESSLVYGFRPKNEKIRKDVEAVLAAYKSSKAEVLEIISQGPEIRLRYLLDAFRLKSKDDKNG